MKVPDWLKWFGTNVVLPLIRDEVKIIAQKELEKHGVGIKVPQGTTGPGVLMEQPR